ncbi:MAG: hypothetical protein KDD50_15800, partial [Bdellovibrionales bacterium]|nr:hypothetical protein [Bdellovibrionales bacterium]
MFSCLFPGKANASNENELITRYAIFPISVEKAYLQEADDSWWNLRKEFLKSKLYLVSSKKFMQQKGVFQPRQSLEAADVIILARLLDAHALVITNLKDRNLSMIVYQGNTGKPLWQSQFELNAAIPIKRQLNEAVLNLMNSYLADIPYQGYVIKDDLIGKVLYEEDGKKYVKVNVGASTQISEGEKIQFFELESVNAKNLYQGGSQIKVFAEGV